MRLQCRIKLFSFLKTNKKRKFVIYVCPWSECGSSVTSYNSQCSWHISFNPQKHHLLQAVCWSLCTSSGGSLQFSMLGHLDGFGMLLGETQECYTPTPPATKCVCLCDYWGTWIFFAIFWAHCCEMEPLPVRPAALMNFDAVCLLIGFESFQTSCGEHKYFSVSLMSHMPQLSLLLSLNRMTLFHSMSKVSHIQIMAIYKHELKQFSFFGSWTAS